MGAKRSKDKRAMAPGCHASGGTEAGIGEAVGCPTPVVACLEYCGTKTDTGSR